MTAGTSSVDTKGEMGMEPPLVLIWIGFFPYRCSSAALSHRPGAESKLVRKAR
jgi:hypothetical protein